MARHSVIIGVGGTGQYILTLIKKELLEINRGEMPKTVKLLSFDTMPETATGGQQSLPENVISIQNVSLDRDVEFIGLSGNGWQLGQAAVNGTAPHISRWFDAPYYQKRIPPATWDLAAGAARIRQFGRLAFFMRVNSGIRERIQNAFTEIKGLRKASEEVEVIIVGSFAGGTGAGMLIDMGIMCRDLGNIFDNQLKIRGIFVLPTAFINLNAVNEHGRHMMARSFAAWRELDRFMNLGPTYGAHKVAYQASGMDVPVTLRPFDECFLVDSRSDLASLETVNPERGVFPVIANFISLILDNTAGLTFAQRDINLIVPLTSRGKQGYTALRTYTIKVPIYYDIEIRSLRLTKDLLERWLLPTRNAAGNITGLADNKNNEIPNTQGRDQVIPFLEATVQRIAAVTDRLSPAAADGSIASLGNTFFLPHIASIYKLRNIPEALQTQKDTDAMGGYVGEVISQITYAGKLVILPNDYNQTKIIINGVSREVDAAGMVAECNTHIWDEVQPSDQYGDHPADAVIRFQDPTQGLPAYEKKHFGAGAGSRGRFGEVLEESSLFQIERFRELLRQWILNVLNGAAIDPFVGIAGKLGYVSDFCDELVRTLDFFTNDYLNSVKKLRDGRNMLQAASDIEANAQSDMEMWANRRCAFFFTHPRSFIRQNQYLVAVDDRHQIQRDDMVLDAMMTTGQALLKEARRVQSAVQSWVQSLAVGGQNNIGLLKDVDNEALLVSNNLRAERDNNPTQVMTPEKTYVQDVNVLNEELKRISWNIDLRDGFNVQCRLAVPTDQVDSQGVTVSELVDLTPADTAEGLDTNKKLFKKVARNVYRQEWIYRMALDEMMRLYKSDPVNAGTTMKDNCDVLLRLNRATVDENQHERSVYLRVMNPQRAVTEHAQDFIQGVNGQICRSLGMAVSDQTVESDDPYKITLLRTTHRVQDTDFEIWESLRKEYIDQITADSEQDSESAARMHIFPAECNSVRYESQLNVRLGKPYRAFHPEVVMLLEYADRVSLFLRCWAYGFIKQDTLPNSPQRYWYLDVPRIGQEYEQHVDLVCATLTPGGQFKEPTWFDVLNAFAMVGRAYNNTQKFISFESLRMALAIYEARLRETGELSTKINAQIKNEDGIICRLHNEAEQRRQQYRQSHPDRRITGWTWNDDGQEYFDLEDLAHMMLLETLTVQRQQVTPSGA